MTNTDINYTEFIKYVHKAFEDVVTLEEVEKILYLEDGYNKDSPASIGKRLIINRLIFKGEKVSGEEFHYDQEFYNGINVLIADNHKGKSTVFKIIKFALTGRDSIKADIKPWITDILLEFNIGEITYTCNINRLGRDKGALYSFGIDRFYELQRNQKIEITEIEKEFDFNNNQSFQDKIQEFFFEQFSFYTLKYTGHKSAKDDFSLTTGNLSWATYFKSIYLESKNYEHLYFEKESMGAQGRKIFEMILGLHLTYPINMLTIQRDKVLEEIGRLRLAESSKKETTAASKNKLEKKLKEVTEELEKLLKGNKITFNEKPLIQEYNTIQVRVNENRKQTRLAGEIYQTEKNKQSSLEEELRNLNNDKSKIETEINKLSKQLLNVELYTQTESFFSNLDIKVCPHCETEVSEVKKENERTTHSCSLCGELSTQQKAEIDELNDKKKRINEEKQTHSQKLEEVKNTIKEQRHKIDTLQKSIAAHYSKIIAIPSVEGDLKRLKELETIIENISNERHKQTQLFDKKDSLIKEEAVLKFQLSEIEKEKLNLNSDAITSLNLKKEILEVALEALEKKRNFLNKNTLSKLEQLILNEVHAFGIESITQIIINEKYDLVFTQNGIELNFGGLSEGEKLRVKLAFYLSFIQLDIEHNLGRHPRFLIFDSPGNEEMVPKHLQGLSDILLNVNKRFKNQLQIFIGTALREFSQITDKEKVFLKSEDEFIF